MKRIVRVVAGSLLFASLAGCASTQRLTSYGDGDLSAGAQVVVQGHRMNVSVHPRDDTLLAQKTVKDSAASGFLQGLTFGIADGFKPDPREVDIALARFVSPTGCEVAPVVEVGSGSINFEASYSCPPGVDLRALMRAQQPALMRGEALRPDR